MATTIEETFHQDQLQLLDHEGKDRLGGLIQADQYVGEVFSLGYDSALVQIHDFHRQKVGGIPSLSFLIATRLGPGAMVDFEKEDASIVLLRVMDAAPLPQESEAVRIRVESAQRVSGESERHWDEPEMMDAATHNLLSFAGVKCRVIGTFYLDLRSDAVAQEANQLILRFGSDISNYYPNRGLKVYKPNGLSLRAIVNYRDMDSHSASTQEVDVGTVRYASTNRSFQNVSDVPVVLNPRDLLGQKTALFGMTRTGKSNTTKVILKAVFDLRFAKQAAVRIGQIVFDPSGEYANENVQDATGLVPSAVKNIAAAHAKGDPADIVTYGVLTHPNDPNRKFMLLNFVRDADLQAGKEIINSMLAGDSAKYIGNFRQVVFERPDSQDKSATTRYARRVLAYRALLAKAGFAMSPNIPPATKGLFNQDLVKAMDDTKIGEYVAAAKQFANQTPTWRPLASAFEALGDFFSTDAYKAFDAAYAANSSSGETWADEDLKKIIEMFRYPNGARQIGKARPFHSATVTQDFTDAIYDDLVSGRLVIIDQSSGEEEVNRSSADRIMQRIFDGNRSVFRAAKEPPEVIIYVEEAHNLLPAGSESDLKNVWVRTAKEGRSTTSVSRMPRKK